MAWQSPVKRERLLDKAILYYEEIAHHTARRCTLPGTCDLLTCTERTLTNLYHARSTWLDLAHKRLDDAVFAVFGWQSDLSDAKSVRRGVVLEKSIDDFPTAVILAKVV